MNAVGRAARTAWRLLGRVPLFLALVAGILGPLLLPVILPAPASVAVAASTAEGATVSIANREIVVLHATLQGATPPVRAARARMRINSLNDNEMLAPVTVQQATLGGAQGLVVMVGGRTAFALVPDDLDPEDKQTLAQAAEQARTRLEEALQAKAEQRRWPVILWGIAHALAMSALAFALLWGLRRFGNALRHWLERHRAALSTLGGRAQWREYLVRLVIRLLQLGRWIMYLIVVYAWLTYVLDHFPLTQPYGRGLGQFVVSLASWLFDGIVGAIPGIITVALIVFVAQAIVEVVDQFFESVRTGRTQVPFLHADTVAATRRIVVLFTWVLAVVVAYPFIPGSDSDAFKGLSVLFGIVVSLGSTGLVNQMMSGLVIVYSRALRRGDFVLVNGMEGVVSEVGALATKIVTMTSEEITIPNATLIGNSIHNYSKLAGTKGSLLSTKVTIGYDAPWRQVHAMLEEAAARTSGLRVDPKPFVYQRALSDFYVEYELFAYVDRPLDRVPMLSALHANIQDTFNEHGVQILSPHFVMQPGQPVVVPPEKWHPTPATPPDAG
jgi:small-conductance mechanosensitive channel